MSASADLSAFRTRINIQWLRRTGPLLGGAEGLLLGFEDDSLRPGGTATRAQIATILMRFLAAVSAE